MNQIAHQAPYAMMKQEVEEIRPPDVRDTLTELGNDKVTVTEEEIPGAQEKKRGERPESERDDPPPFAFLREETPDETRDVCHTPAEGGRQHGRAYHQERQSEADVNVPQGGEAPKTAGEPIRGEKVKGNEAGARDDGGNRDVRANTATTVLAVPP